MPMAPTGPVADKVQKSRDSGGEPGYHPNRFGHVLNRLGEVAMSDQRDRVTGTEQPPSPGSEGSRHTGGRPLGLALTFAVAVVVFVGVGLLFHAQAYSSPVGTEVATPVGTSTVDGVTMAHVSLHFNTYPDASGSVNGVPIHPGGNPSWPSYGPTNQYQVPAHALVTVYIRQYDSGGSLNNPWFDAVRGTVGSTAVINGKTVKSINPNNVGHTFTIRGTPGLDPNFFVNVPLPAVPGDSQTDNGKYETITFSFISGDKGTYAWNCEFPCGTSIASFGGPMNAFGYMSGFLHVV
jgi:hypothetical protein